MTLSSEILSDSPVIYLKLDETSGTTAADSSGNANNFTYNAAVTLAARTAPDGSVAPASTGTTEIASLASVVASLSNPTAFTLECGVYIDTVSEGGAFMGMGNGSNGYHSGVGSNTFPALGNEYLGLAEAIAWKDGNILLSTGWKWLAMTRDASGWYFYINGSLLSTLGATAIVAATGTTHVGGYATASRWLSAGNNMCHAAFYATALSAARIKVHADLFLNRKTYDALTDEPRGTNLSPWMPYGESLAGGATVPTVGQLWPRSYP